MDEVQSERESGKAFVLGLLERYMDEQPGPVQYRDEDSVGTVRWEDETRTVSVRLLMDCMRAVVEARFLRRDHEAQSDGLYQAHPELSELPSLDALTARLDAAV